MTDPVGMRYVALLAVLATAAVLFAVDLQAGSRRPGSVSAGNAQGTVDRARTQLDRNQAGGQQALQGALGQH